MTPEQFCYWLQGKLESTQSSISQQEANMIRDHLNTVFKKETPEYPPCNPSDLMC